MKSFISARPLLLRAFLSVISVVAVVLVLSSAAALSRVKQATGPLGGIGNPCVPPGVSLITDPSNDTGLTLGTVPGTPAQDMTEILIAEPNQGDAINRLAVTIRVADLTALPQGGIWRVFFTVGATAYWVGAVNDPISGLIYTYGTAGTTTTTLGNADGGTMSTVNKTFTILISNSKVGNPGTGTPLTAIYGRTQTLIGAAGTGATPSHDLAPDAGAGSTASYVVIGSAACPGGTPTPTPTATPTATPTPGAAGPPRYLNHYAPLGIGENAGEPSLGVNWNTEQSFTNNNIVTGNPNPPIPNGGTTMYFGGFMTAALKATFDDCSSPASVTWDQKALTGPNAPRVFGDPILFTDHQTGRTFVSQLLGLTPAGSTTEFTDNDGNTFTLSQGSALPSDIDHQTIGGGPPHAPLDLSALPYKHAVYYASQSIADAKIGLSIDGGVTFQPPGGFLLYTVAQCAGLHGHIKVAPDGTVYLPNKGCGPGAPFHDTVNDRQTLLVSGDNAATWAQRPIPLSTTNADRDPSIGVPICRPNDANCNKAALSKIVYFGYQARDGHARIARTTDSGLTWSTPFDVGAAHGIQNMAFAEVVAGDADRAAFAFFGSTSAGQYDDPAFPGVWYLYIATTKDGGATWTTVNATPNDPIQRGGICGGGTCRNLLDFFDITIDKEGRVLVAGEDGCIGSCIDGPPNSFTAKAFITRQSGGYRLFANFDPVEPTLPGAPLVSGNRSPATTAKLSWLTPDNGGAAITGYNIYRSTGGPFTLLASTQETNYTDTTSSASASYRITALNSRGEGPYCHNFVPPVGSPPTACVLPGILTVTDILTDGQNNDFGANVPADPSLNVRQLFIAEPFLGAGVKKLVFTIQVGISPTGTPPPSSQWYIIWNKLNPNANFNRNWVGMKTSPTGAITFEYGDFGVGLDPLNPNPNANLAVKIGNADSGSYDPATGVIRITVSNNKLENIGAGQTIAGIIVRTFLSVPDTAPKPVQNAADTTDPSHYDLVGNCLPPTVPLASIVSRKTHTGVGPFDVNLLPSGVECRTGAPNGAFTMVFTFANPLVSVGGASVTSGPGSVVAATSGINPADNHEYIANLTGVTNASRVTVTLTNIVDTVGNTTASLPGTMGVLLGDTTGNGATNSTDVSETKINSGKAADTDTFRTDVTISGVINSTDVSTVKANSGTALPP